MRFSLALALIAALSLSACYRPLYGDKAIGELATPQESKLNSTFIAAIDGENGQKLRNLLIDRMYGQGRPAKNNYRLEIDLKIESAELGLQKNAITTRARATLSAKFKLVDSASRVVLFAADTRSIVSYSILSEQYATLASRENAYERGMVELADRITNRLLLYFGDKP